MRKNKRRQGDVISHKVCFNDKQNDACQFYLKNKLLFWLWLLIINSDYMDFYLKISW